MKIDLDLSTKMPLIVDGFASGKGENLMANAYRKALKREMLGMLTDTSKIMRERTTIRNKDVKERVSFGKLRDYRSGSDKEFSMSQTFHISGRGIRLSRYKLRKRRMTRTITPPGGGKPFKRHYYITFARIIKGRRGKAVARAWVISRGGVMNVVKRKHPHSRKSKLHFLYSTSVRDIFRENERVNLRRLQKGARERFMKNLNHEIKFRMSGDQTYSGRYKKP